MRMTEARLTKIARQYKPYGRKSTGSLDGRTAGIPFHRKNNSNNNNKSSTEHAICLQEEEEEEDNQPK
jgi:hypothetical protein